MQLFDRVIPLKILGDVCLRSRISGCTEYTSHTSLRDALAGNAARMTLVVHWQGSVKSSGANSGLLGINVGLRSDERVSPGPRSPQRTSPLDWVAGGGCESQPRAPAPWWLHAPKTAPCPAITWARVEVCMPASFPAVVWRERPCVAKLLHDCDCSRELHYSPRGQAIHVLLSYSASLALVCPLICLIR